jgi:hypothetical protein
VKAKVQGLYCLKDRYGSLYPETIETSKVGVWFNGGFSIVCQAEGEAWRVKYWKRDVASMAWAMRHGWSIVVVKVEEE